MPPMRLILASASPRRADLLRAAAEKSAAVAAKLEQLAQFGRLDATGRAGADLPDQFLILAADTSVVVGGEILGKPLDDADVARYVASGEGRDKAGGYAIQGRASRFIPRIDGSYSNVVGLPVALVHELLASLRVEKS